MQFGSCIQVSLYVLMHVGSITTQKKQKNYMFFLLMLPKLIQNEIYWLATEITVLSTAWPLARTRGDIIHAAKFSIQNG